MSSLNTEKILEGLKEYFVTPKIQELVAQLGEVGVLKKITISVSIALQCIVVVERLALDLADMKISGSEKKKALVKFLDDAVDVPFWLEPIDGMIIGIAIDAAVGALNVTLGRQWITKLKDFSL